MKYYGKIVKKGGKLYFYPMEAVEAKAGVAPGEEQLFPAVEQAITPVRRPKPVTRPISPVRPVRPIRPVRPPLTPEERKTMRAEKIAQQALMASSAAEKGLIVTRPGSSVGQPFYHKKFYAKEIAGRGRVTFFDIQPDPDGIITNVPEPYFRSPATFIGIKIDLEPTPLKAVGAAHVDSYLSAIQALTNSVLQLRINDQIAATFSFKDIAPVIETDIGAVANEQVFTIHFKPRPMVEFGDILKSNYFSVTSKDRVYLVLLSDVAFPLLPMGLVDFSVKPYLFARVPRRLMGG